MVNKDKNIIEKQIRWTIRIKTKASWELGENKLISEIEWTEPNGPMVCIDIYRCIILVKAYN